MYSSYFLFFFLLIFTITATYAEKIRYDNYKVYRITPKTLDEVKYLHELEKRDLTLDFWKSSTGIESHSDILVSPHKEDELIKFLADTEIEHKVIVDDAQKIVEETAPKEKTDTTFGWTDYHNLTEVYNWLDHLANTYPEQVKIIIGGFTYEKRVIKGIKLSFKKGNKAVFIEGTIHAREWIATSVVTYLINEFLTSKDPTVRDVAESYDWYIFPTVNPDGYEYTFTTARFWRQNRQKHFGKNCIGADMNRNFGYHWNEGGTSNDSCNEKYPGPFPFSEIDVFTLASFISSIHDKLIGYFSFHSYSQLLLIPYGYINSPKAENYDELFEIGTKAIESLERRHGTKFRVGKWDELMYISSGVSVEWVKGTFKTPITYTYELRDTGYYGFALPADQIIPSAEEILDSFTTLMLEVKARGY